MLSFFLTHLLIHKQSTRIKKCITFTYLVLVLLLVKIKDQINEKLITN